VLVSEALGAGCNRRHAIEPGGAPTAASTNMTMSAWLNWLGKFGASTAADNKKFRRWIARIVPQVTHNLERHAVSSPRSELPQAQHQRFTHVSPKMIPGKSRLNNFAVRSNQPDLQRHLPVRVRGATEAGVKCANHRFDAVSTCLR